MKDQLIEKVSHLYEAFKDLNDVWNRLDWSVVPETINENYPFHQDLVQMQDGAAKWLEIIKKS